MNANLERMSMKYLKSFVLSLLLLSSINSLGAQPQVCQKVIFAFVCNPVSRGNNSFKETLFKLLTKNSLPIIRDGSGEGMSSLTEVLNQAKDTNLGLAATIVSSNTNILQLLVFYSRLFLINF